MRKSTFYIDLNRFWLDVVGSQVSNPAVSPDVMACSDAACRARRGEARSSCMLESYRKIDAVHVQVTPAGQTPVQRH